MEIDIPFTPYWIEVEIEGKWFDLEIRELYIPDIEAQKVLGSSDSRPIFAIGLRLP